MGQDHRVRREQSKNSYYFFKTLQKHKAIFNVQDIYSATPLYIAAKSGNPRAAASILLYISLL